MITGQPIEYCGSTNPSNPTLLLEDASVYQTYNSGQTYYYRTNDSVNSSNYQAICLHPSSIDDSDLYLYSNAAYSTFLEASTRDRGRIEWIVFRPSSSKLYYPKVYSNDNGYGYLEWDQSSRRLALGESVTTTLAPTECMDLYQVYLNSSLMYKFELDVPENADFDLYLYWLPPGFAGDIDSALDESTDSEGNDDAIEEYQPPYTGDYVLLVIRWSGTGGYTLTIAQDTIDYTFIIAFSVFISIIFSIIIAAKVYQKYRTDRTPNNTNTREPRIYTSRFYPTTTNGTRRNTRLYRPPTPPPRPLTPPPLPVIVSSPSPPLHLVCVYCNHQNDPTALFCTQCGTELYP